ncbi:MAG: serine/threonine protein kinase [Planctomycetes bacterium]|nr:serine/threonine protein kinase [Planctomycetota bacterium]
MSNLDHAKLRELFDRAMQLAPSERQAFLDSACRDDAALRERAGELVKAAEAEGTFLSSPTGDIGTQTRKQLAATIPLVEGPGTRIGLYKLLQLIGEGGFGSVFLAEQEKPVRRRVALKIIKLGMDTRSVIARFEAERQALALMDHPHIAKVLDAGATESGRPFFVMEYVVGDAITRFADAHKLAVKDRLELFAQVCQAVQHAHTKGIIHRDLKPGNILVSMSDGKPFAKVIDFGIAKATAQPLTDKTLFTEHRQLIGTPEYMSPEQAEGSPDIDTRTDVYALGVLLYELLTGATPFEAKRLRSAAYAEMQRIIREEEPPMPSVRLQRDLTTLAETASARRLEPAALNSQVKGELDWIVMKALDKERARRYESASQLAMDVQRHVAGEVVNAAPPSVGYRVRKFVRRNKGAVMAVTAVTLAIAAGASIASWQWIRAVSANAERERIAIALERQNKIIERTYRELSPPGQLIDTRSAAITEGGLAGIRASDGYNAIPIEDRPVVEVATLAKIAVKSYAEQADEAEWNAYTANIALAQASMEANNWPEARKRLAACPESKRSWEWHLLDRRSNEVRWAKLGDFKAAAMSRDGKYVATLSNYAPPQVWDAQTGARLFALKLDDSVNCIAFSPDASRLVTATIYGGVDSWDLTGKHLHTFSGHSDQVNSLAFANDGEVLVTASIDHTARVWNAADGKAIQTLRPNDQPVTSACITPDGARIATSSSDGTLRIWDRRSGDALKTIPTGDSSVWSATFAPDGKVVATVSQRGDVSIWNCESGAKIMHAEGACSQSCQPYFAADGKALITGSFDHSVVVRDPSTLRALDSVALPKAGPLRSISGDAQGNAVASVSSGPIDSSVSDTLEISELGQFDGAMSDRARESGDWDASLSAEALLRSVEPPPLEGRSIVTPKGDRKISIESDRTIRLSEPVSGKEVATFSLPDAAINLRMRGDGAVLIISLADEDSPELFWDIRDSVERMKDRQREWAEQPAADSYVDALLVSAKPTKELDAFLRADESLTPLRRLVAWRTLRDRLADLERDASDRYEVAKKLAVERQIKEKAAFAQLLAAELAAAKDLGPRIAESVRARAEKWEYQEPKPSEAGQLSDAVRRADLLEAAGIMQRHLQPSEEDGYVAPNSVELHRAYSLRLQHLGENNDETFEAEIEMLANDANYLGEPDARAKLDKAILQKESRTPKPDAQLFRAWQFALDSNCDSCDIDRAEYYAKKIADSFRAAAEGKVKSIQVHEPVKETASQMYSADNLSPAEIERVERVLSSHRGEFLRRRCVNRTSRNLWHVVSNGVPDWAATEPAFDVAKIQRQLISECRQLLTVEPESVLGYQTLALALYRTNDLPAALEAIDRSISLGVRRADKPETQEIESQPAPVARAIRALILVGLGGEANLNAARDEVAAANASRKALKGDEAVLGFSQPAELIEEAERETNKAAVNP